MFCADPCETYSNSTTNITTIPHTKKVHGTNKLKTQIIKVLHRAYFVFTVFPNCNNRFFILFGVFVRFVVGVFAHAGSGMYGSEQQQPPRSGSAGDIYKDSALYNHKFG